MCRLSRHHRLAIVHLLLLLSIAGCQTWNSSLPGFGKAKSERRIEQQAKNDPFPSPRDVGIQAVE